MTTSSFHALKLFLHEIIHTHTLPSNYFTDKITSIFFSISLCLSFWLDWDIAEYGCMLRITEKSDVYSFGVVLLQIITGKRPVDASFAEEKEEEEEGQHVIGWVIEKLKSNKDPVEIVDSKLQGHPDAQMQEMLQALGIALLCTSHRPEDRPTMKDVAALLREIKHDSSLADQAHKPPTATADPNPLKATSQASSYSSSSSSLSVTPAHLLLHQHSSHSSTLAYSSSSVAVYHPPAAKNHSKTTPYSTAAA